MDAIILNPGSPLQERLRTAARQWAAGGKSAGNLLTGTAFFLAQCWLYSSGAWRPESPLFNQAVHDYVAASKQALGGDAAWNAMLAEKAFCSHCALSFRLENLALCADCLEYVCPSCTVTHHENCGGELVG